MHGIRRAAAVLGTAALAALTACSTTIGTPEPATDQAADTARLWRVFFWAAVGVASIVYALIGWSVLRYRSRGRTDLPRQFREHIKLEIVYVATPLLIVIALFVLTVRAETRIERLVSPPSVTIRVDGFTWSWRFSYVGTGVEIVGRPDAPPEVVLPAGERVRFELVSDDVIHAFFVPGFLFKRDVIPGQINRFDVEAPLPGRWGGKCAEFCGLDHARMTFAVRALPADEFRAWLESQRPASS